MADTNPTPWWLSILQLVISWQVVVFVAFFSLRTSLVKLIREKLLKVKAGPLEFELAKSGQDQAVLLEGNAKTDLSILDKATFIFRPETVAQYQEYVKTESNYVNQATDREKYETLLKYSTTLYIIKTFEMIYNLIWGSQIQLIQYLNSVASAENTVLEFYYNNAKAAFPEAYQGYTVEEWSKFLVQFQLMNRVSDNQIEITAMGIDFLKFLADSRKSLNKPY